LGVNALVLIKRLLGSEELFPDSVSKPRLLLTRLIFDRDLMDRDAWVKKVPQSQR
jgi:hypothetical protein